MKDQVLSKALELENKEIEDTNVRRVRAEMAVISQHKSCIKEHETAIAAAQKNVRSYSSTPALTSKDVLG